MTRESGCLPLVELATNAATLDIMPKSALPLSDSATTASSQAMSQTVALIREQQKVS